MSAAEERNPVYCNKTVVLHLELAYFVYYFVHKPKPLDSVATKKQGCEFTFGGEERNRNIQICGWCLSG